MANPWFFFFFFADNPIVLRTLGKLLCSPHLPSLLPLALQDSPLLSPHSPHAVSRRTLVISPRSSHPLLSTSTASNANRSLSATVPEESAARVQWNSAKSTVAEEFLSKRKKSLGERYREKENEREEGRRREGDERGSEKR